MSLDKFCTIFEIFYPLCISVSRLWQLLIILYINLGLPNLREAYFSTFILHMYNMVYINFNDWQFFLIEIDWFLAKYGGGDLNSNSHIFRDINLLIWYIISIWFTLKCLIIYTYLLQIWWWVKVRSFSLQMICLVVGEP